ncbi:cobalt-precorrin-6A reductase [Roseibium sp.]|uniref:cobalt-precorrin-6A reductase n=1 Tax=Roseibium sp. TaxID=1936156 RepID=UPI003A9806BF
MRDRLKVLLLAGTQEARQLAKRLPEVLPAAKITASFAGAVTELPDLGLPTRIGGFGGGSGLADYCRSQDIDLIVDATHPFAVQMSRNAASVAEMSGIQIVRLERPPWEPQAGDRWQIVADLAEAATLLPARSRPFIAVGRKEIGRFYHRKDIDAVVRMIEPPEVPLPALWQLVLARPSREVGVEQEFLQSRAVTHVVAKNSGGHASYAKIEAARNLGLPVLLADRPELPKVPSFGSIEALCDAVRAL